MLEAFYNNIVNASGSSRVGLVSCDGTYMHSVICNLVRIGMLYDISVCIALAIVLVYAVQGESWGKLLLKYT